VSGFGPFALPAAALDADAGAVLLPGLVVVGVGDVFCASNKARATFWLPGESFW